MLLTIPPPIFLAINAAAIFNPSPFPINDIVVPSAINVPINISFIPGIHIATIPANAVPNPAIMKDISNGPHCPPPPFSPPLFFFLFFFPKSEEAPNMIKGVANPNDTFCNIVAPSDPPLGNIPTDDKKNDIAMADTGGPNNLPMENLGAIRCAK